MRQHRDQFFWRLVSGFLTVSVFLLFLPSAHALEKATVQLKWFHHFQFAGYYAAVEKGFYRAAGLDVTIKEGGPTIDVDKDVLSGRADFGTGTSDLLLQLAKGEAFVVLGQVFQHSPAIFLTPRKTGIRSVADMARHRFMYSAQHGDMLALLKKNGVSEDEINKVPHNGDPRDLLEGKAEVMLAYNFNEPYIMELAGEPYFTFSPLSFGIDFYGDNFFTTRKLVNERPEFVKAFREATLRGWRYAMENKAETVDLIRAKYSTGMSREYLLFEADHIEPMIQPALVELGYQSLSRWQRISETYTDLGMLPKGFDPSPVIYIPKHHTDYRPFISVLIVSLAIIAALIFIALTFRRLNLKLVKQIEDRRQVEDELLEIKEIFSLFMKYSPIYTFIKRIEGNQSRVIEMSDNFIDMVGRPAAELRGRTMSEMFPDDFARKITADDIEIMKNEKIVQLYEELNGRSYTTIKFPILREGKENLLAGFTIDITEQKSAENERLSMERQLLHGQKLESLGVLAGGIAHDFNNILTAIIGNIELARMRIGKDSPAVDTLQKAEQSALRAADLAGQMLAYSGRGKFLVESLEINRLIEDLMNLLEVSLFRKCALRLNLSPHLPCVEADATQIRQVIMNLVINASEAIGSANGVITIRTSSLEYDMNDLHDFWLNENMGKGPYVSIEISDTGCGMDKKTLDRIFDPFFTTKFTGRGLGMAAVLGIVRSHKGGIKVESEKGAGTSFRLIFPASSKTAEIVNIESAQNDWHGSGRVLLVDDEEAVREIGSEMLQELGFTVITAVDGIDALKSFRANPDISFVILDLTMPNMDGGDCFAELKKADPEVRVIMSSGYSEDEIKEHFNGKDLTGFIQKPYKLAALKGVIRRVLYN